jgi:hypothetical protein
MRVLLIVWVIQTHHTLLGMNDKCVPFLQLFIPFLFEPLGVVVDNVAD